MSFRTSRNQPPTNLVIHTSSNVTPPVISTPTNAYPSESNMSNSPRRAPLPPSPTRSTHNIPWLDERSRSQSLEVPHYDRDLPPLPTRSDKRLPFPPNSPHQAKGLYAGAYDNKLVSSTLSHLPPLPPLSPTSTGPTSVAVGSSSGPAPLLKAPSPQISAGSTRPSYSTSSTSGLVVLPNGTALATSASYHDRSMERNPGAGVGRSIIETMAHSSPSSPWSLLTVHVLPLFAGSPLKTPIEDLNQLCHSHIIGTSQRAQPSRIVALLTSDFREFVASGMLTLKAKFETLDEPKVVSRAAEVWNFFWTQVLPYVEGVFLPFTQIRDLPAIISSDVPAAIPVRHLVLSGFLVHILLPLVSRLSYLVSNSVAPPLPSDLQRILQMSLVATTQARLSSFLVGQEHRDDEVRSTIDHLASTVRWRMTSNTLPPQLKTGTSSGNRTSLQRGPSLVRQRRRGWRISGHPGQGWTIGNSVAVDRFDAIGRAAESAWSSMREDEDDDDVTPGQSVHDRRPDSQGTYASTLASTRAATVTPGPSTLRAADSAYDVRTPQADMFWRADERGTAIPAATQMDHRG